MDSDSVWKGLIYGGVASMLADVVTLPVDVTKTRLQLTGEGGATRLYKGPFHCVSHTVRTEGVLALWKGLEPALWRQATYGSMRYGLYTPIKEMLAPGVSKKELPLSTKVLAGALSGGISSCICNPTDLVKVRMQAQGMGGVASAGQSAGFTYRWFIPSFLTIVRTEGVLGLWKGTMPTAGRATVLAAVELSSYDHIKQTFKSKQILNEGLGLHAATAMCAGFLGAFACNPFDFVKSRVMNQPVDAHGKGLKYKGMLDCFAQAIHKEGIFSLWNGFLPAWARVGPRVVVVFVAMEQFRLRFG